MEAKGVVTAHVDVWNISSSICSACLDGRYENCHCDTQFVPPSKVYQLQQKELSNDSLDRLDVDDRPFNRHKTLDSSGSYSHSFIGEYISDNEFEDGFVSDNRPLPPSTTNWDIIDSVLLNELHNEDNDISLSSQLSSQHNTMQMVFVDSESDRESNPDVEVYYEDNQEFLNRTCGSHSNLSLNSERNIDSRDSGYVTGDIYDIGIEHVTDRKRSDSLEPTEASSRVLTSLQLHEELEDKKNKELEEKKQKEYELRSDMHNKNISELKAMKESLEMCIAKVNLELVCELSLRDELHSHHQALVMDADDIAKSNNCNENTPTNSPSKKVLSPSKSKLKFWRR